MKNFKVYAVVLATFVLASCGGFGNKPLYESNEGVANLIEQLESNFGDKAAFNSILVTFDKQIGNTIIAQGNSDITSNILTEKQYFNGTWADNREITMEIENGKIEDFLFTLSDVDLKKLPSLVKDAIERVVKEKDIKDVIVPDVSVTMPSQVSDKLKDLNYSITVEPETGGTRFHITYDLSGNYLDMVY